MQALLRLREQIKQVDSDIIAKLATRQQLSREIGAIKRKQGVDVIDPAREKELYASYKILSMQYGLEPEFVKTLFQLIITYCRGVQK